MEIQIKVMNAENLSYIILIFIDEKCNLITVFVDKGNKPNKIVTINLNEEAI